MEQAGMKCVRCGGRFWPVRVDGRVAGVPGCAIRAGMLGGTSTSAHTISGTGTTKLGGQNAPRFDDLDHRGAVPR
jgi:hypothetical protein